MKIKNRDRILHAVNLPTVPATSLHLSAGEVSKDYTDKESAIILASPDVKALVKANKFVLVKAEVAAAPVEKPEAKKGKQIDPVEGGKG